MTIWQILALFTPALGALAIVYALRWFPVGKEPDDQYEMDLSSFSTRRTMAHDVYKSDDTVRGYAADYQKTKPKTKR